MAETIEGIGGRKWSFGAVSADQTITLDGALCVMEGVKPLVVIVGEGTTVKHLLVTAPQLWDAANEVLKSRDAAQLNKALDYLGNMVAKSVNKTQWSDVQQG